MEDQRKYDDSFDLENKDYHQHWMEETHDYIQCWFPTSEKGKDENAPLMTKALSCLIKEIPEENFKIIKDEVKKNFEIMMHFWGQDVIRTKFDDTSIQKLDFVDKSPGFIDFSDAYV